MERLAEASGDVEELVAIKAQDLSACYRYLGIAEISGQGKAATTKALGLGRARPEGFSWAFCTISLRDFLVAAYLKRKRNDEALQLTWIQFEERPDSRPLQEIARGRRQAWSSGRRSANRALAWLDRGGCTQVRRTSTSRWKPKPSTPNYTLRLDRLPCGKRTWMQPGQPRMKVPATAAC
jgi:hypothetical protein